MLKKRDILSPSATISSIASTASSSSSSTSVSADPDLDYTSFVGNAPSTALFFLALGIGVLIAFLFMFFTVRYFVRSKFGLHVYPIYRRNVGELNNDETTNDELHDLLLYIREHQFIRGSMMPNGMGRIRRLRNHYSKMRKLSEEEVEILFPKKSYYDWLNGGKERDVERRDGVLHEAGIDIDTEAAEIDSDNQAEISNVTEKDITEIIDRTLTETNELESNPSSTTENIELNNLANGDGLHFSSGMCAICLDTIEDEDEVRGLLCGHVFHAECLDPWLTKRRACCPMCKRDYFYKGNINNNTSSESADNVEADLGEGENARENPQEDTLRDDLSIDYEAFRSDPALRAIIQELIPPSERARMILNDSSLSHLNIEERATEAANLRYGKMLKRFWWRLMGIRKSDILYMEVINLATRARLVEAESENNIDNESSNEPEGAQSGQDSNMDRDANLNVPTESVQNSIPSPSSSSASSASSHNLNTGTQNMTGSISVSDDTRRSIVEQRV